MVVQQVIEARPRDVGGFSVRRVLPSVERRLVGPFIFYDHLCKVLFPPGQGLDVRPHPHIALATITYLFEGAFLHRDSLGSAQEIRPGDVNWMIAGRGIVHSERTPPHLRASGGPLHGIQCWVALPTQHEEIEPSFEHHPKTTIPRLELPGAQLTVIAGTAYGATSPATVLSPTLYVHARLSSGATLPVDEAHEERAVYIAAGSIECAGQQYREGMLLVLQPGASVAVRSDAPADVMLLGGARLDGERHIFWNFVASSRGRIEQASALWREGGFPKVPGDDVEFIPLPEA